jgi:hypothetical protein
MPIKVMIPGFKKALRQRGITANIPLREFKHRRLKAEKPKYDQKQPKEVVCRENFCLVKVV